jgi:predicted molibdopterin-dependent oxidoreductase YjgC
MGESLLEAGCEFCGACIDVCPVGALTETKFKWERASRTEQSVCAECPVGCTMTYEVNNWEKVIRAIPELNSPVNHGQACFKGKFGYDYVNDKRRIKKPMVRKEEELVEVTWDEAIRAAADGLVPHKGEGFALMASPRNTNEELYVAQKFARAAMSSNSVDVASNDRPGIVEGLQDVLGYFAGTMSLDDVHGASVVMAVSTNITEEQNVVAVQIKQAVRAGTQKLIVIDHREVELTRHATLWLRPFPGMDHVLLGGLLRAVIDSGLANEAYVAEHCDGWDELMASLEPFTPEAVAEATGVSPEQIERAATLYATGGPAAILFGLDSSLHGTRRSTSRAVANLALVTGNVGVPNAGVLPLYHGANDQGAWDMGVWPMALPGHVFVQDSEAQVRFADLWGGALPTVPGSGNVNIFNAASEGRIKAMLILGDHVHYEDGTYGDVGAALDKLEFLVVSDPFLSEAAKRADVVFPATTWAEKRGTYTNVERRVQPLRPMVEPHNTEARSDLDIVAGIATAMGARGFVYDGPEAVLMEIGEAVPFYGGITYESLMAGAVETPKPSNDNPQPTQVMYSDRVVQGVKWPCVKDGQETAVMYEGGFRYGKAKLGVLSWGERPAPSDELPLMLVHGRVLAEKGRPADVVEENGRNHVGRTEELLLHPDDAERLGIEDGQLIRAADRDGHVAEGVARLTDDVLLGVVSLTTLFGELATKVEESDAPDAMNHLPRLNAKPVRVGLVVPGPSGPDADETPNGTVSETSA